MKLNETVRDNLPNLILVDAASAESHRLGPGSCHRGCSSSSSRRAPDYSRSSLVASYLGREVTDGDLDRPLEEAVGQRRRVQSGVGLGHIRWDDTEILHR